MDYDLPQPWVFPRSHWGTGCGEGLRAVGPCCQGLLRHHQTQSRTTDCSSNIPPPVQSKVKSPSMTRQPWLTKAVIDHCTGKQRGSTYIKQIPCHVDWFPNWTSLSKQPFDHTNNSPEDLVWASYSFTNNHVSQLLLKLHPCHNTHSPLSVVAILPLTCITLMICHHVLLIWMWIILVLNLGI